MSKTCPSGHFSSDDDFCSECGKPMSTDSLRSSKPTSPVPSNTTGSDERCPDCLTQRPSGARFCEVCRYDFQDRKSFNGLAVAAPPALVPSPPTSKGVAMPAASAPLPNAPDAASVSTMPNREAGHHTAPRLLLRVMVDASLDEEKDPNEPCPVGAPDRFFHLDLDENTLGRQYEGSGGSPEFVVRDPGISRRHAKFVRQDDGCYAVLELGSANGTSCNGQPLESGLPVVLKPGDELTLGMWTRIRVEER